MSEIFRIYGHDDAGELELSPYNEGMAWLEVFNAQQSGFIVLSPDIARKLADELIRWSDEVQNSRHRDG